MSVPLLVGAVGGVGLELLSAAALEELLLAVHGPDVLHHSRGSGGRVRADRALVTMLSTTRLVSLFLHVTATLGNMAAKDVPTDYKSPEEVLELQII